MIVTVHNKIIEFEVVILEDINCLICKLEP